jgi:predicted amidophosphoribosyltransferase
MRTINRIRLQAQAMRRMRQCLNCDRWFNSSGPGNRRCSRCSKDLAHVVIRSPLRCFLDGTGFPRMRDSDLVQDMVSTSIGRTEED